MSEKRTPISIYLSPRAAVILRNYSRGSGYGSVSRTVEEIILAFDGVYKNLNTFNQMSSSMVPSDPKTQKEKAAIALVYIISLLQSINNLISRLSPESP